MSLAEVAHGAWTVFVTILQILSPFLLLWIGYQHTHKEKREERAERNRVEAENGKYKELLQAIDTLSVSLSKTQAEIERLKDELNNYRRMTETLTSDLNHVATLNRLNGRYTHELAQLVVVIGEGVRDQHLDGNITRAISRYRQFESGVIGSFVTDNEYLGTNEPSDIDHH